MSSVLSRTGIGVSEWLRRYPVILLVPVSVLVGVLIAASAKPIIVAGILAIVPVVLLQMAVIRNLFLGIVAYLFIEYLQPGYRVPLLAAIRPALLVAGGLLLAWTLNFMHHRVKLVWNWQIKSYLVLLFLCTMSAFGAISPGMTLKALIVMAKTLAVFFIIFSVVNTLPRLKNLIWTYIALHLVLGVMAFGLFFTTGQRNFGDLGASFLGDENDSAMALLVMIPYAYFMLGQTRSKLWRMAMIVSMVISSAAVLYSFSRGAFLGYSAMMLYMCARSQRKVAGFFAIAALFIALVMLMPSEWYDRIESIQNYSSEGSAQGRLDAWKGGVQMMLDSPIFGVGLGNFNRTYGTLYNTINTRWTAAHSMYVQFIAELGVPGLIFIVTVILLTFRTLAKVRRACDGRDEPQYKTLQCITRGAECGFVAYLISTTFLNSMAHPHLWHFGAIAGCALIALGKMQREEREEREQLELVAARETAALP
jgi:probable O-glycosylation ligase (exosortase A-associated)